MSNSAINAALVTVLMGIVLPAPSYAQSRGATDICTIPAGAEVLPEQGRRSVVITDKEIISKGDFSLSRTLGNILRTSIPEDQPNATSLQEALNTDAERVALLATMIRSFRDTERTNQDADPPIDMPVSFRGGEGGLDPLKLLGLKEPNGKDRLRPVGLFNRFDLAPSNWSYCGEHRIVYAKTGEGEDLPSPTNRFFVIFEAALDNPAPGDGKEGCIAVADFWSGLAKEPDKAKVARALEDFYYKGLTSGGLKFAPVVHFRHFSVPFGQVRGNLFVSSPGFVWALREWRLNVAERAPVFVSATVKANPHPMFYGRSKDDPAEHPNFSALRPLFQDEVVVHHLREMLEVDLKRQRDNADSQKSPALRPSLSDLAANLGARFENRYNAFESVAGASDDPFARSDDVFRKRIDTDLTNFRLPWNLTSEHMLNRAGAISCGGCHKFSEGAQIGPGENMKWPKAAKAPMQGGVDGFTHINEKHELSEALEKHFLPVRCANLKKFVDDNPLPTLRPSSELSVLVQNPRAAFEKAMQSSTRAEAAAASQQLDAAVRSARRDDGQSAGAFTTFRRAH